MARKPKAKPKTPEQIAAEKLAGRMQDFAAVGMAPEAAALDTNADVEIRRAGRKNVETARRADAFDALKEGMAPGCYDAARRLERDILLSRREGDAAPPGQRVDATTPDREFAYLMAADRVETVMRLMSIRDALILRSLIAPKIDATWRATVERLTQETNPHAQGAVVRGACLNLRDAYERMGRKAA